MLAATDIQLTQLEAVSQPTQVQLPAHMANFFAEAGYAPSHYHENRSNARLRIREEATITTIFAPVFVKRTSHSSQVLVKDLSRTGLSILSPYQMWPSETFSIELHNRKLTARVVRCRKLGDACFESGAVLVTIESTAEVHPTDSKR